MRIILSIIIIFLISCSNINIINHSVKEKKEKKSIEKKEKQKILEIKAEDLSTLFFNNYKKVENKTIKKVEYTKKEVVVNNKIDASDYTVIIDWMVNGVRYVKLRNKKLMNEYIIKEHDTNSSIILVERSLFYYKFKIDGQIIEVKR